MRALFYPFSLSRPLSSRGGGPPASHRVLHPPHPGLHPGQRRARRGQPPAQVGGRVDQGGQDGGGRGRRGGGLVRGGQFWSGERESGRGWGATRMPLSLFLSPLHPPCLSPVSRVSTADSAAVWLAWTPVRAASRRVTARASGAAGCIEGGERARGKKTQLWTAPDPVSLFCIFALHPSSSTLTHHPRKKHGTPLPSRAHGCRPCPPPLPYKFSGIARATGRACLPSQFSLKTGKKCPPPPSPSRRARLFPLSTRTHPPLS